MSSTVRTTVGMVMLALLPGEATAQCIPRPLDQLPRPAETVARAAAEGVANSLEDLRRAGRLQVGDGVYLTDVTGCQFKADIRELTPDSLTLADGRDTRLFREGEILKIERQDSVWNGVGAGLGVAALPTLRYLGPGSESLAAIVSVYALVLGGGALIGLAVDANIHEKVYEAPGTVWAFEPLLTNRGAGGRMSVEW